METYVFDCETDGLLHQLTTLHSLVLKNINSNILISCHDQTSPTKTTSIEDGLKLLMYADMIIGHNIIKFDIPAIQKVYPWFKPKGQIIDTLVITNLIWSNIKDIDFYKTNAAKARGETYAIAYAKLYGSQGLKAWGLRMGNLKGDYADVKRDEYIVNVGARPQRNPERQEWDDGLVLFQWGSWSQEMQDYCDQDVTVNHDLYKLILKKKFSQQAIDLEHSVAILMQKQQVNGFKFDIKKAEILYAKLAAKRADIEHALIQKFGWWYKPVKRDVDQPSAETTIPKRTARRKNSEGYVEEYTEGVPYTKIVLLQFNPGSRPQIADRFQSKYGWKPTEFTETGRPKIDETTLKGLPYMEAKGLTEYMLLAKRCAQIGEGQYGWLKMVQADGHIHGNVNPNAAVTARASHTSPNIAQVPACKSPYGKECRELFTVPEGWVLMGSDMSGLELRCLGHYLAVYDDGEYVHIVVNGDIHTVNMKAMGITDRDKAKTIIYAILYGAGADLIGSHIGGGAKEGKALKRKLFKGVPALKKFADAIKDKLDGQTTDNKPLTVKGLDKRTLYVRSKHSALNLILQSTGAILCKMWITLIEKELQARGYKHGWDGDYAFCAWVHDEVQIACKKGIENEVGEICREAAAQTGLIFKFRCPLTADYSVGRSWAETH